MKGSIDLITNAGSIAGRPIVEYLAEAVLGRLPKDLMPTFLHEAAHQWCLWSPVGNALGLLSMEVHRACASDPLFLLVPSAVPVQARASTARRILEPLLEGLAQFAEFDLYCGSSPLVSSLTNWTVALFGDDEEIPAALQGSGRMNALLIRMRLDDLAVRRKGDALVRPLTAERGGYLIGYLTVKNLWHEAQRRSMRLRDPDLFFMYLRSLVFADAGLVQMLLAPPTDEYVDLNNLSTRVHARLKLLHREDIDEHIAAYEEAVRKGQDLDEHSGCLYLDPETVKASRAAYSERMQLPMRGDGNQGPEGQQTARSTGELAAVINRSTIRIRVDEVIVEVIAAHRCRVRYGDELLFEAEAFPEIAEGTKQGSLALYFLPAYLSLAVVCGSEAGAVFAIFVACSESLAVPKEAQRAYAEALARVVLDEDVRALLHEAIESDDFENSDNTGFEEAMPKVTPTITNLYLNHALCYVADEKLAEVHRVMGKNGFWNVLSGLGEAPKEKAERIRGLAALGLIRTFTGEEATVAQLMDHMGFRFDEVVANLKAKSAERGYLLGVQPTAARPKDAVPAFKCIV